MGRGEITYNRNNGETQSDQKQRADNRPFCAAGAHAGAVGDDLVTITPLNSIRICKSLGTIQLTIDPQDCMPHCGTLAEDPLWSCREF